MPEESSGSPSDGTPKGMVELDGQMLMMQKKLQLIEKVKYKPDKNLCKRALQNGVAECNGEDLLTECNFFFFKNTEYS